MVAQNAIINVNDYTTIQTVVSNVLGTGSATLGYGQTVTSRGDTTTPSVTSGSLISYQTSDFQWAALYADMQKIANHQGFTSANYTSLQSLIGTNIASGATIRAQDVNLISTVAGELQTNALSFSNTDMTTTNGILTSVRTTAWGSGNGIVQHIFNVAFGSYDNLRFFFNSGGAITFGASLAGYTSNPQTTNWFNLLSTMGTITYGATGATYSGTGGTAYSIAYGSLTSSAQTIFRAYGSTTGGQSIYTSNFYQVTASVSSSTLTFSVIFDDAYTARFSPQLNPDQINGTLTSSIGLRKAGATYLTISRPVAGDFTTTTALSTG